MTHTLTHFEHVALPIAMPEDDLSTGMVESTLKNSVGGVFDYFGATRRLPRTHQFAHRGKYEGELVTRITSDGDTRITSDGDIRVATPNKLADLHGKVDDLKAMEGIRGRLWRRRLADDQMTWKLCRLLQVGHTETVDNAGVVAEVESVYETQDAAWKAETATTTSFGTVPGVGTQIARNVSNSGSVPVRDAILRVQWTSGTITQVNVYGPGIDLEWIGTILDGQTLVIDDGKQTAMIDATDQYSGLALGAGHTVDGWFPLNVGANPFTVTVFGGNATVSVEHYNQWP